MEGQRGHHSFSGGDPPALLSPTFSHLLTDPSTVKCLGSKDGGATCPKVGRGAENFPAALLGKTLSREKKGLMQRDWEAPAMADSWNAKLHHVSPRNPGDAHHVHQETPKGVFWT